jgi:hypothetical protein
MTEQLGFVVEPDGVHLIRVVDVDPIHRVRLIAGDVEPAFGVEAKPSGTRPTDATCSLAPAEPSSRIGMRLTACANVSTTYNARPSGASASPFAKFSGSRHHSVPRPSGSKRKMPGPGSLYS